MQQPVPSAIDDRQRERLLRMLAAATFIIFFQAYMVAPIIPALSNTFGTSAETAGLIVPAYLIPYGIATLAYGLLADRIGIHRVMFTSLAAFAVLTMLTATAQSIEQLMLWRMLTEHHVRHPSKNIWAQSLALQAISTISGAARFPSMAARCGSIIIIPRNMPAAVCGSSSLIRPRSHCRRNQPSMARLAWRMAAS